MTTPAPELQVESLTIYSRGRAVVRDLSFTATTGSLFWITGENGAGKSSILRVLARRSSARGVVRLHPLPSHFDIAFYSPLMGVPAHATVGDFLRLTASLAGSLDSVASGDPLLPALKPTAQLTRLSTGEAKRLLLWSLLSTRRPFTLLDEPYEHLSPAAKARLTEILVERSAYGVVVVATNQEVPNIPNKTVLEVENL